ncbi:UNVERIFIED_CONTAM: hypothetical protein DVV45_16125, partial [Lactiplantibacillus plantarum]
MQGKSTKKKTRGMYTGPSGKSRNNGEGKTRWPKSFEKRQRGKLVNFFLKKYGRQRNKKKESWYKKFSKSY